MQLLTSILLLVAFVLFVELVLGENEASGTQFGALSWRIAAPGWASGMDGPRVIAVPNEDSVATAAADDYRAAIEDDAHPIEARPVHGAAIRLRSDWP